MRVLLSAALVALCARYLISGAGDPPLVFPLPQEIEALAHAFPISAGTLVIVPEVARDQDLFLARQIQGELAERHRTAVALARRPGLPTGEPFIVAGTINNPLVRLAAARARLDVSESSPGAEGYVLAVSPKSVVVAGSDARGAFYGVQTLRQLVRRGDVGVEVAGVRVRDWPHKPFRGVKLFAPGPENLAFFRRFVRDFLALYKYNTLILEMNAVMRLERHPEVNAGWLELGRNLRETRRDRPEGPQRQFQNSVHHDAGDGRLLEKEEVAELVRFARRHHVDVIPEIPSLTHSYYLLARHRELAEIAAAEWPDTYCPSNPKSYELLFDVLDEYIEVMKPAMIHAGHDEWRTPVDVCALCRGKDPSELFLDDINRIYRRLRARGVGLALWGDHLIERVRGLRFADRVSPSGYRYRIPGAPPAERVRAALPKDILIFNWFWDDRVRSGREGWGESNDADVAALGFRQVYGNLTPEIGNWERRSARTGVLGGAPSCWAATTELSIGKDRIYEFAGSAQLLWSRQQMEPSALARTVQGLMPAIRRALSGLPAPSDEAAEIVPIDISAAFNAAEGDRRFDLDLAAIATGRVTVGRKPFLLARTDSGLRAVAVEARGSTPGRSKPIAIGRDCSSLIFLHAAGRAAGNDWVDRYVYNADDTADLLGSYQVVYEDGLSATVPIRYRLDLLEWNHAAGATGNYCFRAEPVDCGRNQEDQIAFFALEWANGRPGKVIREVRLRGSAGFRNPRGETISDNSVILAAISVVPSTRLRAR